MPDHFHLIVEGQLGDDLPKDLSSEMGALTLRRFRGRKLWQPAPAPKLIPNLHHLKRQIRYVHLNPCRSGIASDPLEWEWSTHRDAVGAVLRPWIDLASYYRLWESGPARFADDFHAYVSGDPSVRVQGTQLPKRVLLEDLAAPLPAIEWVILQVTRCSANARTNFTNARRLMLLLAEQLGAVDRLRLAAWIGKTDRQVRSILSVPASPEEIKALSAAHWILSAQHRFKPLPKSGSIGPTRLTGTL